jgi:cellulose synthase/poly-beta-1,6-N-acetylglucosamine synthase-like glycosyltransferase
LERLVRGLSTTDYPCDLFEVIIVDDRSVDNTRALVTALCAEFPWLRYLHRADSGTKGGGKSGAMNAAFMHLSPRCDIVGYVDADAQVFAHTLTSVAAVFAAGGDIMGAVQVPRACNPASCTSALQRYQYWEMWTDFSNQQFRDVVGGSVEVRSAFFSLVFFCLFCK